MIGTVILQSLLYFSCLHFNVLHADFLDRSKIWPWFFYLFCNVNAKLTGVITGKMIVVAPVSKDTVSGSGEFVLGLTTACIGKDSSSSSSLLPMHSIRSGDKICCSRLHPLSELVSERGRSTSPFWTSEEFEPVKIESKSSSVSIPSVNLCQS